MPNCQLPWKLDKSSTIMSFSWLDFFIDKSGAAYHMLLKVTRIYVRLAVKFSPFLEPFAIFTSVAFILDSHAICIASQPTSPFSSGPVHYNTGPADIIQKYGTGPSDSVPSYLNCTLRLIVRSQASWGNQLLSYTENLACISTVNSKRPYFQIILDNVEP